MKISCKSITTLLISISLWCASATVSAELRMHDIVMSDVINTPTNNNGEPTPLDIPLSTMGRDLILELKPSRLNRAAGLSELTNQAIPYLYEGDVKGDVNSWVRVSILDGRISGYIFHYGKLYQLDTRSTMNGTSEEDKNQYVLIETSSSSENTAMLRSLNLPVKAGTAIDKEQYAPLYELSNDPAYHPATKLLSREKHLSTHNHNHAHKRSIFNRSGIGTNVTRAMRIGIVVDSRFNEAHNGRGLARALSIINSVDAIYQAQLGTAIMVESIRVYDNPDTDPIRNSNSAVDDVLNEFKTHRLNDAALPNDLALVHLFSGHQDPNRVIGLGWISTACRLDGYDLSLSTPYPFDTLLAAHEIAHNLGALHDDNAQCLDTSTSKKTTVMWPEVSGSSTSDFSACSIRDMQESLNASCNQDNIDVGVRIQTTPTDNIAKRSVIVDVANKDLDQRSTEVFSVTRFPQGTILENLSAGCRQNNFTVTCNHGTVRAQSFHSVRMDATLLSRTADNVTTDIELVNAVDIDSGDNRAVLQLLRFDQATGVAIADQSVQFNSSDLYQENDTFGGTAAVSPATVTALLLLLLRPFASLLLRRRAKRHALPLN